MTQGHIIDMAIFDYEGYNQALSDAEADRAAAVSARNKLRSDLQAKGVTSWRSDPQYQALTNQINQANQTVVILKKNSVEPGEAAEIDFGGSSVPSAATDSRTRLELQQASQQPPTQSPGISPSGTKTTSSVTQTPTSRTEQTVTSSGGDANVTTNTPTFTRTVTKTSVPDYAPTAAQKAANERLSNADEDLYNAQQDKKETIDRLKAQGVSGADVLNHPDYKAANAAYQTANSEYASAQQNATSLNVPGTSTTSINSTTNNFASPTETAYSQQSVSGTDPASSLADYGDPDAAVDAYRANTQASINQQLADRDAYEAGVEGEYDYYENPADDPNLWYDDSLGEYVPRTDRPEDWQARDQNEFVYNDDLGEWVPREDLPDNWNYGDTTVTQEPQYDDFGCIIGQEEYDDTDGVCVPIGGTSNYLGEPIPVDDEFTDVEAEQLFDEFELSFDETPEPPISIREARKSNNRNYDKKDWRFKIRLSPFSDYLYNDPLMHNAHVLAPLKKTDGVIFPYTPSITVPHMANYASYALTHSNYRGFFYQGSQIGDIVVNGTFTAQDTDEANYLLAAIHFFKSATKMFYGQDQRRGVPPPLLYMNGFGDFQFAEHPCVLSTFNYTIPDNVDYVRAYAGPNTNNFVGRTDTAMGYQSWSSKITRLITSKLESGAPPTIPDFDLAFEGVTKISQDETYVPTKIGIQLTFHPVDSRDRISNQFSLRKYAYGDLTKKGFW